MFMRLVPWQKSFLPIHIPDAVLFWAFPRMADILLLRISLWAAALTAAIAFLRWSRTEAHDPSLMKDPHLIIYHPVREAGCGLIVTNGDQTDTIWEYLARGESWEAALRTRTFEDDGPNWTPRISGLLAGDGSYKMSILKAADAEGSACARFFYEYPSIAGLGHFIHTYVCDGNPVIPTFQGEPERVSLCDDIDAFTTLLWENLNEDNKISLFVRYTDRQTGKFEQRIVNKHQ